MLLNKSEEIDEEQGFIKAKQQFSIDYKHMFSSLPKKFRRNPFTKKIRTFKVKIQSMENIKLSPFINQSVRQETLNDILKVHHQNVIYNGFNNQVGQAEINLTFDANFPMGNLEVVTRVKNCHYEFYMRPDTNTNTHFQWFYFRVHVLKKRKVRFTIKNFIKSTMLYSKGLRPFYQSKKQSNQKYVQLEEDVTFVLDPEGEYYNLTFNFQFKHDNDEVYFASQPPYGYEDLEKTLCKLKNSKRFIMGKTILGNKLPYLVFNQKSQPKVIAVAIARQHPGETVGSWMMEGFIKQINKLQFSKEIQWIVIPMINIDGVELGNNRTGVLGHDFNRNWDIDENSKKQKMFPQISSILDYLKKLKRKHPKKIKMFLDFHGHSSEQNVFAYGPQFQQHTDFYFLSRVFPELIAKKNGCFKLCQTSYKINNDKKNAARSIILHQFKIPFTYTIQCTFGVMDNKPVGSVQTVKIGEDIAIAANEFLENLYTKQTQLSNNTLIQQVRQKYINYKHHENEEYESASEQSQNNPDRKQFQQNIQELLQESNGNEQKRSSIANLLHTHLANNLKLQTEKNYRKNSQESFITKTKDIINNETVRVISGLKTPQRRVNRVMTEGSNPQMSTQCVYFPPVKTKYGKRPVLDRFSPKEQEVPAMMNMQQIQQRLFRLRNSRIGKKILVINAYGV